MKSRLSYSGAVGAVALLASVWAQAPGAQAPAPPQGGQAQGVVRAGGNIRARNVPTGPAPRLADGKPDLSGVWLGGMSYGNIASGLPKGQVLEVLPRAQQIMAARLAKDDPGTNCLPITPPRGTPYPWRIVQTPTHAFVLYEMYDYRQVFMDGRAHPSDVDPTWHGHSIGRWEGDTLVIDTVGFNDKGWFDSQGHPVSEKLHLIERFTRTDMGTMAMSVTVDDPQSYGKPFTVSATARLMPGEELREYVCAENNQDIPHIQGPAATQGVGR